MTPFDYLSVFISIVLGLAITHLLASISGLIRERAIVRPFLPVVLWLAILLLVIVQSWWAMFDLRDIAVWTFFGFATVLLHSMLLFVCVDLASPNFGRDPIDLAAGYWRQRRAFFGAIIGVILVGMARPIIVAGSLPSLADFVVQLVFLCLAIAALAFESPRFHRLLPFGVILIELGYICTLFLHLR